MNNPSPLTRLIPLLAVAVLLGACERPAEAPEKPPAAAAATEKSPDCVRTPPAEPMVCTMDWRPVCGCDGITYPNACSARAAGVPEFSDGECAADATRRE